MPLGIDRLQRFLEEPYNRSAFIEKFWEPIFDAHFEEITTYNEDCLWPLQTPIDNIFEVDIWGKLNLWDNVQINCYEVRLLTKRPQGWDSILYFPQLAQLLVDSSAAIVILTDSEKPGAYSLNLLTRESAYLLTLPSKSIPVFTCFSFLLGEKRKGKIAAQRFIELTDEIYIDFSALLQCFSKERLHREFLEEYKSRYAQLLAYRLETAVTRNVTVELNKIQYSSAWLLCRILFLYFLENKGWLSEGALEASSLKKLSHGLFSVAALTEEEAIYFALMAVFHMLQTPEPPLSSADGKQLANREEWQIPFLNLSFFQEEELLSPFCSFPAHFFHHPERDSPSCQKGFLDFLASYNYLIEEKASRHHTIAITADIFDKLNLAALDARNENGACPPSSLARFMCQEALLAYLHNKSLGDGGCALKKTQLELLVAYKNPQEFSPEELRAISASLDAITVCEPACQNSVFLMNMLQEIYYIQKTIGLNLGDCSWEPTKAKEKIIQNSIYAALPTKEIQLELTLRLGLSYIAEAKAPSPLPNFDVQFVQGNGLISQLEEEALVIDWSVKGQTQIFLANFIEKQKALFHALALKQAEYKNSFCPAHKQVCKEAIQSLKIELLILLLQQNIQEKGTEAHLFPKILRKKNTKNTYLQTLDWKKQIEKLRRLQTEKSTLLHCFDWRLNFPSLLSPAVAGEGVGFDVLIGSIGNLPGQSISDLQSFLRGKYSAWQVGLEPSYCRLELSLELLKPHGYAIFVLPNAFLHSVQAQNLRNLLLRQTSFRYLFVLNNFLFEENTYEDSFILAYHNVQPVTDDAFLYRSPTRSSSIIDFRGWVAQNCSSYLQNQLTKNSWLSISKTKPPKR
jgi:hypothetical protein